jgi:hypothetical protein
MIKRSRSGPPQRATSGHDDAGKRSSPDDVRQLLGEWRRQIVREKAAAKKRRLLSSELHPALLDEITVVTRIGRLRLPRKPARGK